MALTEQQKLELQQRFGSATASGKPELAAALCVEGARVWHNFDDQDMPYADTGKSLIWLHQRVPDIRWVTRNVCATSQGWIWQATITGSARGGVLRAHTCMVVTLNEGGLITRLDEYIDPVQMAPVRSQTKLLPDSADPKPKG